MNLDKETLAKWKEDAKKAWYEGKFSNENLPPLASIHIANACPQNFIALIDKILELENHLDIYCKCPSHGPSLVHFNENE